MIIRLVKLTFHPEYLATFLKEVEQRKESIRNFEGCTYLQILQDNKNPCIVFSHSYWNTEEDLNNYRHSDFFKEFWNSFKVNFAAAPEAWSTNSLHELK